MLVRGLEGEGPGDIVGAFAGEADVDPADIGEIDVDVDADEALVEVDLAGDELARLVDRMDDNRIGRSTVRVTLLDGRTRRIREYVASRTRLVELEREAEMERHEREIRELSGPEREAEGRALIGMRGRDEGEDLAGRLVTSVKRARSSRRGSIPSASQ